MHNIFRGSAEDVADAELQDGGICGDAVPVPAVDAPARRMEIAGPHVECRNDIQLLARRLSQAVQAGEDARPDGAEREAEDLCLAFDAALCSKRDRLVQMNLDCPTSAGQIRTCNLSFVWCTPHRLRLGV